MTDFKLKLSDINSRIKEAQKRGGKSGEVYIVGATKTLGADVINEAVDAGLGIIGENRVQEFLEKYDKIKSADFHFIGHLQTNKVKYIIDKVSLIHSVDSVNLLREIDRQAKKTDKIQSVLVEVNISGEQSKFGTDEFEVYDILDAAEETENIKVSGLMTMAPYFENPADASIYFKNMYNLFIDIRAKNHYHRSDMKFLSMGMSNDFEVAVEQGANMVRLGTVLFGERQWKMTNYK